MRWDGDRGSSVNGPGVSGTGGYAERLDFCVSLDGCWDTAADRGENGRSGGAALPFNVRAGDMTREGVFGDNSWKEFSLC